MVAGRRFCLDGGVRLSYGSTEKPMETCHALMDGLGTWVMAGVGLVWLLLLTFLTLAIAALVKHLRQ